MARCRQLGEAQWVITLQMILLGSGSAAALSETQRMIYEKIIANAQALSLPEWHWLQDVVSRAQRAQPPDHMSERLALIVAA